VSKRREQRPLSRKERKAIEEIEEREMQMLDAYAITDPYDIPEDAYPSVADMLESGDCNFSDR